MTAYASAHYDDLRERIIKGEKLSPQDQRKFNTLDAEARAEWENAPRPFQYGGDMEDVF